MRSAALPFLLLGLCAAALAAPAEPRPAIRVASAPFTESYILSEAVAQIAEDAGEAPVERRFGMGGPPLVFGAVQSGQIDLDVTYTGTLIHQLLKDDRGAGVGALRATLAPRGLSLSESLGFNNTYAIAIRGETARALRLRRISDLRGHPELRGAFTPDFLNYDDGFYKLTASYGLAFDEIRPMQHSLAYQALQSRQIDLTDAYTTDGTLAQFDLVLLQDDLGFFPKYYGVLLARTEFTQRFPRTWAALRRLEGQLSEEQMTRLNQRVESKAASVTAAARDFLQERHLVRAAPRAAGTGLDRGLWRATWEHLLLVVSSLVLSMLWGIPLGIAAFRYRTFGHVLVAGAGLLQTIPSLALLCFLIPVLGIGALPTVCALFIYGLLPIVQSTSAGLLSLDPRLTETARILGLGRWQRLRLVELPLASIHILAGVKTTAVINVATATIAALIGAGGYGRYITSGLAMNDIPTILQGAIPTALMAVGFHVFFELTSPWIVPRGLRIGQGR